MDEAASNMRVQLESTPEEIDSLQRALYRVQVEEKALSKEKDKVSNSPSHPTSVARLKGENCKTVVHLTREYRTREHPYVLIQ